MEKLSIEQLHTLEAYDRMRSDFRQQVMQHKQHRRLPIGPDAALYFEDRMTMHYQVQEMLRAERIFNETEIRDELDAYNPLIPDGKNLKATFMMEIDDPAERKQKLAKLIGVEAAIWLRVQGHEVIRPVANEDLVERTSEDKTSSVHFLRFEFSDAMIADLKNNAELSAGIDHAEYQHTVSPVPKAIQTSLLNDFD